MATSVTYPSVTYPSVTYPSVTYPSVTYLNGLVTTICSNASICPHVMVMDVCAYIHKYVCTYTRTYVISSGLTHIMNYANTQIDGMCGHLHRDIMM